MSNAVIRQARSNGPASRDLTPEARPGAELPPVGDLANALQGAFRRAAAKAVDEAHAAGLDVPTERDDEIHWQPPQAGKLARKRKAG